MASDYINALLKKEVTRTPIWVMRQAGRYLPEYRETRKKAGDFLSLCKSSELACEVTLQPLERFDLDAAILFSDILTIPDAFDLGLAFHEGEGPKFSNPISSPADIHNLKSFDVNALGYVFKAVEETRKVLPKDLPLIGFCGSPWTLAAYSIEGGGSKNFQKTKDFMVEHPLELQQFLEVLTQACFEYLKQQALSGVCAFQIFDSWADLLSIKDLETYSLNYTQQLAKLLKADPVTAELPIILFEKAPKKKIVDLAFQELSALSLHWQNDLAEISKSSKSKK